MKKFSAFTALKLATAFFVLGIVGPAVSQSPAQPQVDKVGSAPSVDQIWDSLIAGNKRFVAGNPAHQDAVSQRRSLEKHQHPLVAVLSCSDSRVPPESVFDQGLGDLFVVRVAGNSADAMAIGSLEYAVEHLGTTVIVVLGHESCGAVTAACSDERMPSLNLEAVAQPIFGSCKVAKEQHASDDVVDFAIRHHVHETATALLGHSQILRHAHDEGKLSIIEAYYSLDSGAITRLR